VYIYLIIPFQAIGGMNICTARLPAEFCGVATILLTYYLGSRLFNRPTGLAAAATLALCPYQIQFSRWALEACIGPVMLSAAFAALLYAGVPCVDLPSQRPRRVFVHLLAGVVAGLACYGYASLRLILPATLFVAFCATFSCWFLYLKDPGARRLFIAMLVGMMLIVGPLAWQHLRNHDINRRARDTAVWSPQDSLGERALKVAARYPPHFGYYLLFGPGSADTGFTPPTGFGYFPWYALPLLLVGAGALFWKARTSLSSRLLLAMLLSYPVGDLFFGTENFAHPLRSLAGVVPLCLTAGLGVGIAVQFLSARGGTRLAISVAGVFLTWVLISHATWTSFFFGDFNHDQAKYWQRHVDLLQVSDWLKPRLDNVDAVFVSRQLSGFPYASLLVYLNYDPHQWFADEREYIALLLDCNPTWPARALESFILPMMLKRRGTSLRGFATTGNEIAS
jgi:4-amino-4-deoxy-L-arabinose transferase-like glycosyltransferase